MDEIIKEQCTTDEPTADQLLNGSNQSLASTAGSCSVSGNETATTLMNEHAVISLRSPSEGYKSDYGSSGNITESDNSLSTSGTLSGSSNTTSLTNSGQCPKGSSDSFYCNRQLSDISMGESLFNSTISLRSEELQARVRKLCQSTT
jgi:hypothetical protein